MKVGCYHLNRRQLKKLALKDLTNYGLNAWDKTNLIETNFGLFFYYLHGALCLKAVTKRDYRKTIKQLKSVQKEVLKEAK